MFRFLALMSFWLLQVIPPKAAAQDSLFISKNDSSYVSIIKDNRVDGLIKRQIQVNEETSRNARRQDKGFRLLVISTTLRDEALAAKTKVYSYFPELKAYLFHQSPYYKVKAGCHRTRLTVLARKNLFL